MQSGGFRETAFASLCLERLVSLLLGYASAIDRENTIRHLPRFIRGQVYRHIHHVFRLPQTTQWVLCLRQLSNCGVRHIDTPLRPDKLWRALP
jgi:hypothetical protein